MIADLQCPNGAHTELNEEIKMKTLNLPENFYPVLPIFQLRDKFWLEGGVEFELVEILNRKCVKILTFTSNGKDYKCNVWNNKDVFYFQEM